MKPNEFITGSIIRDPHGIEWTVSETHKRIVTCVRDGDVNLFDITSFWAELCELILRPHQTVESIIINCFKPIGFKLDSTDKTDWILNREEFKIRIDEPLIDKEQSIWHIYVSGDKIYEGKIKTIQYANLLIENLGL